MSGSFKDDGSIDWGDGKVVSLFGKKRSGKSIMGKYLLATFPGDRIVLDVAGDDGPHGPGVHELVGSVHELPTKWPEHLREDGQYMTLRYAPDAGSPTFAEDMDAIVGLALRHGLQQRHKGRRGCLLLIHEIGVVAPANRTQPHMRRALMHNRHNALTMIACGPRPKVIDPLVLQQSDVVYVFELMNPEDRRRIAESIGWNPADFDTELATLRRFEHLRYDANEHQPEDDEETDPRLVIFPPLPSDIVASVE